MTKYDEYESPLALRYASKPWHDMLKNWSIPELCQNFLLTQRFRQRDKEDIFAARKGFDVAKALALARRGGKEFGAHSDHR